MLTERTCFIPGCDKPRKMRFDEPRLERWCSMHYERYRKHGAIDPRPKRQRLCDVPGCGKPHHAHGYCPMHLERWQKTGDPGPAASTRVPRASGPRLRSTNGEEKLRKVWRAMHARCVNPKDDHHHVYGGRGIRVCGEWNSYEPFRAWSLSAGYQDGLTIDRIDNDGNYEPGNCRWATHTVQARNKGNNHLLTAFGETKTMKDWSEDPRCQVSYGALHLRLVRRKWDVERALTTSTIRNNAQATHCPKGHPYSPENTMVDAKGWRKCKTCNRARSLANYRLRKAAERRR